jgi:RHS repeat-associated protein
VPSTGETTLFVYDASGKMVAEYSTAIASQQDAKVSYLTSDHLGSPRINTDANGQVIARHDYQPFGEEITRASYGADSTRQKFTAYERDTETDLDFAQARYYAKNLGRFNSPDPIMLSPQRMVNPQMINLYVYAVNNPFSYIDSNGQENVQLGEDSEKKIKADLEAKKKELKADKKNETLKAEKKALETSLNAVREGNRVVGAWLQALKDRGEDNGMQLSDYTFSTNPQVDLATAARADGRSEATIANEGQYWQGGENGAVGTVIGGKIYILNNSNVYQNSLAGSGTYEGFGFVGAGDLSIIGGSYLRHEKDHTSNPKVGRSEFRAFSNQFELLTKINTSNKPFQNQKYFKDISNGIQRRIAEAKSAEGIK